MNIKSPSQTMTADRCMFKWYLGRKLGVQSRYIEKRDLAACVGQGVGGALALYYRPDSTQVYTVPDLIELATTMYQVELQKRIDEGKEYVDCVESELYPSLINGMLTAYMKKPFPQEGWEVLGTEYQCGEDNKSFIDIYGKNARGLWLTDFKCKMIAKPYQITQELAKYAHSWQLGHYAWSLSRHLGELPKTAGISLMVGDPIPQHQYMEYEVDPAFIKWWEAAAFKVWDKIEAAEEWLDKHPHHTIEEAKEYFGMATDHMDGIWKCEFTDPCFMYGGDVSGADSYIQVVRA